MGMHTRFQMTSNLSEFLSSKQKQKFATDSGNKAHSKMQYIVIDSGSESGDNELILRIKSHKSLLPYFSQSAYTEVPIAGKINGKIISRRIDRMCVNHNDKSVVFIDYKTDTDKNMFRDKYLKQMNEYSLLLKKIYPDYSVRGFILWLTDFEFEQIS